MTLPNSSSTSAVPYRSTLRIVAGDACVGETPAAWISPVTSPRARGRLDERVHGLARGHVDRRDAHLVSGVPQDLCRRIGVLLALVGQQDMLTDANPARDRLTDLTGSDDDDYISHSYSLS